MLRYTAGWIGIWCGLWAAVSWGAEPANRTAAELLPPSCVAYTEIRAPRRIVDWALSHPLRKRFEGLPEVQAAIDKYYASEDYKQLQAGLSLIEQKLGGKAPEVLEAATAGGVYAGFDLLYQGGAVLVRGKDAASVEKLLPLAAELARDDATKKSQPDPVVVKDFRGITVYKVGDLLAAQAGPWLVFTNKPALGKHLLDAYLDGAADSFATTNKYKEALRSRPGDPAVWSWVDLGTVRTVAKLTNAWSKKSDNPGAEFLLGGVLAVLERAPAANLALDLKEHGISLSAHTPLDPAWVPESRAWFFGDGLQGRATPALAAKGTLATVSLHRDLGRMWQLRDELFTPEALAKMAEADSNLTTLFAGRDFGAEVLTAFEPQWQFIAARRDFAGQKNVPGIRLPAGAVVLKLKKPEEMQRALKVQFQSFVGFANIAGAQNKLPQLEQNTSQIGNVQLISAEFLPEPEPPVHPRDAIHYNLAPAMALVGPWCIIASHKSLALELAEAAQKQDQTAAANPSHVENSRVQLEGDVLKTLLADNRNHLVAQNILEKGHEKADAEREIDGLLLLASCLERASLKLTTPEKTLRLELELRTTK